MGVKATLTETDGPWIPEGQQEKLLRQGWETGMMGSRGLTGTTAVVVVAGSIRPCHLQKLRAAEQEAGLATCGVDGAGDAGCSPAHRTKRSVANSCSYWCGFRYRMRIGSKSSTEARNRSGWL
jgi:hypothetical protein